MHTRFAVIKVANGVYGTEHSIAVAYNPRLKKWAARLIAPNGAQLLTVRRYTSEERVLELRHGIASITNADKPFIEIGMLLRRHAVFHDSLYGESDAADMRIPTGGIVEYTWKEVVANGVTNTRFLEAMTQAWTRLREYTSLAHSTTADRFHAVLYNAVALRRRALGLENMHITPYIGNLMVSPGARWKGLSFALHEGAGEQFLKASHYLYSIGQLIGQIKHCERVGDDRDGLVDDLRALLTDVDQYEACITPAIQARLKEVLESLADVPFMLLSCNHFEMRGRPVRVTTSEGRKYWCQYCNTHHAVDVVDVPGSRYDREFVHWSENHEAYYTYDIDAQEDGDDEESDRPDYENSHTRAILEYSTNVLHVLKADLSVRSSPYGDFLMGLELELTVGEFGNREIAAKKIVADLGKKYCVIKNDGSLPTGGIEVVTAPRGLAEHMERLSQWAIDPAWRAWDTNQCGLHVHIHSKAFTEMTLGKFLMFINLDTNAPFIRKIAGRHPLKDTWAARYCAHETAEVLENPKEAIKGKSSERYRMVNTQNLGRAEAERLGLDPFRYSGKYDTVELRVFKASLKRERLLAQVEFAHAAVMFCRVASYKDLTGKSFLQWLAANSKLYPNLSNWYGTRKSKVVKELGGGKPIEEVCEDKVDDMVVPTRAVRATRPKKPLKDINKYLTPRERREGQAREIQERIAQQRARLDAARASVSEVLGTSVDLSPRV